MSKRATDNIFTFLVGHHKGKCRSPLYVSLMNTAVLLLLPFRNKSKKHDIWMEEFQKDQTLVPMVSHCTVKYDDGERCGF